MKYLSLSFPYEIARRVCDHEVMLSFNSDDAGIAFREWWEQQGSEQFNQWLKNHEEWGFLHEDIL